MHGHINVKSPNNTCIWQMGFNSVFKGLIFPSYEEETSDQNHKMATVGLPYFYHIPWLLHQTYLHAALRLKWGNINQIESSRMKSNRIKYECSKVDIVSLNFSLYPIHAVRVCLLTPFLSFVTNFVTIKMQISLSVCPSDGKILNIRVQMPTVDVKTTYFHRLCENNNILS
jgi:hypothetical protein